MSEIIIIITLAVLFFIPMENLGWLAVKVLGGQHKQPHKEFPHFVIHIFVGLLVYAMIMFGAGIGRILSKELVLVLSALPVGLIAFRISEYKDYAKFVWKNKILLVGTLLFFYVARFSIHRPIILYDGLWYHIPIPKLFLQEGHIDYNGGELRYSLQPFLNFYWNFFPLSLPISTPIAGLVINWIQAILVGLSGYFAGWLGKKHLQFNWLFKLATPTLLGLTTTGIFYLGGGYNDLYGYAFALITTLYVYNTLIQTKLESTQLYISILLIIATGLLKIFFSIYACILLAFVVVSVWEKLRFTKKFFNFALFCIAAFVVFVAPWLLRSYLETGNILYPIGEPWLSRGVYQDIGVGTEDKLYGDFIWERFFEITPKILIQYFSPLVFFGVIGIVKLKDKITLSKIWYTAVFSLIITIFLLIKVNPRYLLGPISVLMFLGLTFLNDVSKKRGLFISATILLIPALFLNLAQQYNDQKTDYKGRQFLHSGHTIESYIDFHNRKHANYFRTENTPIPDGLNEDMPIYLAGYKFSAYIENPYYNYKHHRQFFNPEEINTVEDFKNNMRELGITYVLSRDKDINRECKAFKIPDHERCHQQFEIVLFDSYHKAFWYKI